MALQLSNTLLGILAATATTVLAHSHVNNLVINGVYWQGYDPTSYPYMTNPPTVVGWTAADLDNGFVSPDAYQSPDIICHKNATPAGGHATVQAGDKISIQWGVPWPESHHGPVISYLASCGTSTCETVDKTTLRWFKLDNWGYINGSNPGTWASDVLIANNNSFLVQIPATLAAGNYVLRHEIIALHSAGSANGAQNYPQCFNLAVTGNGNGGNLQPSGGVLGTDLYKATDAGILYNLYTSVENYMLPGPTLYSGFASSIAQSQSVATATSAAIVPGKVSSSSSSVVATTTMTTPGTTPVATSSSSTSTAVAVTPTTTAAPTGGGGGQTLYGQCGGSGWAGPTACAAGSCKVYNEWYAQCV